MNAVKRFNATRTAPMFRTRVPDVTTYAVHYPGVPAYASFHSRTDIFKFAAWLIWNAIKTREPK